MKNSAQDVTAGIFLGFIFKTVYVFHITAVVFHVFTS